MNWHWVIADGLLRKRVVVTTLRGKEPISLSWLARNTKSPILGAKTCPKCRRPYFYICVDCEYRNGGVLQERVEPHVPDLVDYFARQVKSATCA